MNSQQQQQHLRPTKFTLRVGKYLYYIGIEFSDRSSVCFTEQPDDTLGSSLGSNDGAQGTTAITTTAAAAAAATSSVAATSTSTTITAATTGGSGSIITSPEKRAGTEPGPQTSMPGVPGQAQGGEKVQTYEIVLEDGEYVVEVWGRLFARGTFVSSVGLYTNKERAFGPFGNVIGKPFNFTAPSPSHFLLKVTAVGTTYNGGLVLKRLTPVWETVPPESAPLEYRPRMLATVFKKLTELKTFAEGISLYISRSLSGIEPDEELLSVLGLGTLPEAGPAAPSLSISKKKVSLRKLAGMEATPEREPWALTCFRLAEEVLYTVEDIRKNYPATLSANLAALRMLTDIEGYTQSLKEISCAYVEDDDIPIPKSPSMQNHSSDINPKVSFYIIPEADKRLVLAVEKGLLHPGAKIVAAPFKRGDDSQQFIFTPNGMIKSLKSGLVLTAPLNTENCLISGVPVTQEEVEDDPAKSFSQRFSYYTQSKSIRVVASTDLDPEFYEQDNPCLCLQLLVEPQNEEIQQHSLGQNQSQKHDQQQQQLDETGQCETKTVVVATPLNDRTQKWFFKR